MAGWLAMDGWVVNHSNFNFERIIDVGCSSMTRWVSKKKDMMKDARKERTWGEDSDVVVGVHCRRFGGLWALVGLRG